MDEHLILVDHFLVNYFGDSLKISNCFDSYEPNFFNKFDKSIKEILHLQDFINDKIVE